MNPVIHEPVMLLPVFNVVQNTLEGVNLPQVIPLVEFDANDQIDIGRGPKCEIQISSRLVGRTQAIIKRRIEMNEEDEEESSFSYFFVDKSSTRLLINSIPTEKKRNTETRLKSGDLIDLVPSPSFLQVKFETIQWYTQPTQREVALQSQIRRLTSQLENQDAKVISALEAEWTCTICSLIFISPCTLPCGHTFCTHCASVWLSQNPRCSLCNANAAYFRPIRKNVAMSDMIERMFNTLLPSSEGYRAQRAQALMDRQEEVSAAAAAHPRGIPIRVPNNFYLPLRRPPPPPPPPYLNLVMVSRRS